MEVVSWEEAEMMETPAYPKNIDDLISQALEYEGESEVIDLIEFSDEFYKAMFPNKTEEETQESEEDDLY